MPNKRRQRLDISAAELDAAAKITSEDVLDAQRTWREDATAPFDELLDALPDDDPTPES